MSAIQMLLMELDHEARATRRVLERVPGDRLNYRPHEKSMSLGQLALHVAIVPGAIAQLSRKSPVQVPEFKQPSPQTAAELVPALDQSLAQAREVLGGMDDASLERDVAPGGRRPRGDVAAGRHHAPRADAEPLVPPPRSAVCLSAGSGRAGAVGIRAERGREPVRGAAPDGRGGLRRAGCDEGTVRAGLPAQALRPLPEPN